MATLPRKKIDYDEWIALPERKGEEVVNGQIRTMLPRKAQHARVVSRRASQVEIDGYFHSATDLIVEVLSPSESRREIESKLADYEAISAPEAWLVSPEARTVEMLRPIDGRLRRATLQAEGTLDPCRVPGVQIDIASIWPD